MRKNRGAVWLLLNVGDLAGAAERFVERQFQDKVVALWTMGPGGDQNSKYNRSDMSLGKDEDRSKNKESAYEAMNVQGQIIGVEVIQTANRIERMSPVARIEAAERVVSCATKPPSAGRGSGPGQQQQQLAAMDLRLMLIRINQIAITGVSGEVVTNIYYHLKKDSPFTNTIMVTIANDRLGYIADDANWERVTNATLARGCAENAIVNNLVEMMNRSIQ